MKKNYNLMTSIVILMISIVTTGQNNPDFTLASNGVTCLCPNANFGDTGTLTINGQQKTFTKRTRAQLDALIANNVDDLQIPLTCTSGITDMSDLFENKGNFNQSLNNWDVSNVTIMFNMFHNASSFNSDISAWDTSNVADMGFMFLNATSFNQDISDWDTLNVTNMIAMFEQASSFNSDISAWDVSNVSTTVAMFKIASSFNSDISAWDTSNVTNMAGMFEQASSFNSDLSAWDTSNVTNMNVMFYNATSFNQDISSWCVEQIPNEPIDFATNSPLQDSFLPDWGATCSTIGIAENTLDNFKVYPNPVENQLNLSWSSIDFSDEMNIQIFNLNGEKVFEQSNDQKSSEINVSQLSSGVYLLKIISGEKSAVRRIVKK